MSGSLAPIASTSNAKLSKQPTAKSSKPVSQLTAADEEDEEDDEGAEDVHLNGFGSEDGLEGDGDEEDSPNEDGFQDDSDAEHVAVASSSRNTSQPSISEIRDKLHARIAEASSSKKRPHSDTINGEDGEEAEDATGDDEEASIADSQATSRDALLAERKRRGEMRDKRRRERKAARRLAEQEIGASNKRGQKGFDTVNKNVTNVPGYGSSTTNGKSGAMSDVKKALKKAGKRTAPAPQAGEDQDMGEATQTSQKLPLAKVSSDTSLQQVRGSAVPSTFAAAIAFSSLDFTPTGGASGPDAHKLSKKQRDALGKSNRLGVTSHDPNIALKALSNREDFLSKLTPAARERAEEKDKWERMGMRAGGSKVYDDEHKLKKMVKRKEKIKAKSSKDWADRKEHTAHTQATAQKKREENIAARLQQRKDKKMGVKKSSKSVGKPNPKKQKKGRPGFEGKGAARKG